MGVNTSGLACCDEIEDKERMNRKNKAHARRAREKADTSAEYIEDRHALQGKFSMRKHSPRVAHYLATQTTPAGNLDTHPGLCC